jgi:hypothetical protein
MIIIEINAFMNLSPDHVAPLKKGALNFHHRYPNWFLNLPIKEEAL